MFDMLRETRAYQELIEEGRKEGLELGRKEGIEEGLELARKEKLYELHQVVMDIVLERFPKLARFAKSQLATVDNSAILRHLIVKLSTAQTINEAKQYLLAADEDEEGDDE